MSPERNPPSHSPVMHLLGAKCQRKEHTGGGEPASGIAFQGHVLPHLPYNRCTNTATRPRGRPGPPNFSRGPAAAHPAARWGMTGVTRGFSSRSFGRGAAQPGKRGGQGRSPKRGRRSPRPLATGKPRRCGHRLPRAAGWLARRRGARRPCRPRPAPAGPVRSPPAGRAGSARACPTALFLIRAELASGPPRPLDPRAPGAAGLTFPARPGPARRLLRAAPSEARFRLLSHSGRPPLRPSCERPSPPWPASAACVPAPLPQPSPFYACAPRGPGPEGAWPREAPLGAPRLRLAGLRRAPSYRPTVATQPGATVQVASGFWVP